MDRHLAPQRTFFQILGVRVGILIGDEKGLFIEKNRATEGNLDEEHDMPLFLHLDRHKLLIQFGNKSDCVASLTLLLMTEMMIHTGIHFS